MGLLDRFKKAPGPDALTWEAVARLRVIPGVAGAEAVDADTVEVAWPDNPYTSTRTHATARDGWSKSSGFARKEIMIALLGEVAQRPGQCQDVPGGLTTKPPHAE